MKAKRRLGQNFLVDSSYQERIIRAVNPRADETIIEIGPGHGALTEHLVDSGARVIAIELDHELILPLRAAFATRDHFSIIQADALEVDFAALIEPAATARVVANLPYYISTPIMQRLIEARTAITEMTVMLQREVVECITAAPGGKEYGFISVLVQYACEAESLFDVPPGAFRPAPKVWSSVLRLTRRAAPVAEVRDETMLIELAKVLFSQRRKTIFNNLRSGYTRLNLPDVEAIHAALSQAGLDPQRRAETLTLTEMAALTNALTQ
ncbi:MAG: 16S rRNA (adenine(1518)-N(6)/adenine(1519)-N(6))-dimethyltransferase RsmA [Acidobacteria bacterium]|nr:16S rRNA (adenine(1518)-N(6)/adenine(1519)-N(6))-dimethyltransferase RsmA [Acidobacteriota bacterium]